MKLRRLLEATGRPYFVAPWGSTTASIVTPTPGLRLRSATRIRRGFRV